MNKLLNGIEKHPVRTMAFLPIRLGAVFIFVLILAMVKLVKLVKE